MTASRERTFMKRWWLAALVASVGIGCGSESKTPDWEFRYGDLGADPGLQFEIPNHVFDLVTELPPLLPDADGYVPPDPDVPDVSWDGEGDPPKPDVKDTKQDDGACQPACKFEDGTAKECGPDGCGSICGYCDWGQVCADGLCKEYCEPKCTLPDGTKKQCGPDGCYGDCPPGCSEGYICGEDQLCYPFCDHDANCAGKECGSDGCGGTCGLCGIGLVCEGETGLCVQNPCGDVPEDKGKCADGNVLQECTDGKLKETPCATYGADYFCKWDGPAQKFVCSQGCVPQCKWDDGTPKECGYDGCYGECGTCTPGWTCKSGTCFPVAGAECGWITDKGWCDAGVLWFCVNNKLYIDDCLANGMKCGFDTATGKFKCKV